MTEQLANISSSSASSRLDYQDADLLCFSYFPISLIGSLQGVFHNRFSLLFVLSRVIAKLIRLSLFNKKLCSLYCFLVRKIHHANTPFMFVSSFSLPDDFKSNYKFNMEWVRHGLREVDQLYYG
jgi:hypothetical protein